jgi:hypothetical protein
MTIRICMTYMYGQLISVDVKSNYNLPNFSSLLSDKYTSLFLICYPKNQILWQMANFLDLATLAYLNQ